jgi:hypothetical protein
MKKMRLDLEQLAVESFATTNHHGAKRGTVRGHGSDEPDDHPSVDQTNGDLGSLDCGGTATLISLLRTQCC